MLRSSRHSELLAFSTLVIPFVFACTAATPTINPSPLAVTSSLTMPAELEDTWRAATTAWNQDDPAQVSRFFADDAVVIFPTVVLRGEAQFVQQWLNPNVPVVSDLVLTPANFVVANNLISEHGRYSLRIAPPNMAAMTERGVYAQVWAREPEGAWRIKSIALGAQQLN
jgi:ketosteroid isomerase-like protein